MILPSLPDDSATFKEIPVLRQDRGVATSWQNMTEGYQQNYRDISLTYVCWKIMEHVLCHCIMAHIDKNNTLINSQHGFCAKHSYESQLLSTVDPLARSLDNHKQTDVIILDFSKAFDTVPHQRLRLKLKHWRPGKDVALDQFLAYK